VGEGEGEPKKAGATAENTNKYEILNWSRKWVIFCR